MDGTAWAGIGVAIGTNLLFVAYSYGQVRQSIKDLSRRVSRVEDKLNGWNKESTPPCP